MVAALSTPAIFAQGTNQPTVDELIAKNIEAKGGATALNNLQALRSTGKLLVPVQGRIELAYLQTRKRPDEVRTEASLQGMTQIEAYDGKEGWKVSPFFGRKDPERMSADDVKALVEDTEMGGPLADWKAKGSTVEYLGTEDVDGTPAHKLKVVRKNGDVSFVYLDPDHFLEIRIVTQRTRHGAHAVHLRQRPLCSRPQPHACLAGGVSRTAHDRPLCGGLSVPGVAPRRDRCQRPPDQD